MNLAISNLAWNLSDDLLMFDEIKKLGINKIEGVLSKIDSWENLNEYVIKDFNIHLHNNDIEINSIQSIFYGTNIDCFTESDKIIKHIKNILKYAKILGINAIILGSPKIRKNTDNLYEKLNLTFSQIDKLLDNTNINILIEPNAKIYGGAYFFKLDEIISFLNKFKFNNIKTMIDTHNLILEGDNPCLSFELYQEYIGHIHVSEFNLLHLSNLSFHKKFSKTLKKLNFDKIITLEMKNNDKVIDSIKKFHRIYS